MAAFSRFSSAPSRTHPVASTHQRGSSGFSSVPNLADHRGFLPMTSTLSRSSLCFSPFITGHESAQVVERKLPPPFSPSSATSSGIIVHAGFTPELTANHMVAITGMRPIAGSCRPRAPFTPAMLAWLYDHIDINQPQQRLILGAALLGYFFMLRSSEFLGVKGGRHCYALEVRDVEVLMKSGVRATNATEAATVTIRLRGSKNDQHGVATVR